MATAVNQQEVADRSAQRVATQMADANLQLLNATMEQGILKQNIATVTRQIATVLAIKSSAEQSANIAHTQVAVVAATVTQIAAQRDIVVSFANVLIQSNDSFASRNAAMSALVERYPDHVDPYIMRGFVYASQGQRDLAIADYTKALELQPMSAVIHDQRGQVYAAQGDMELAIADYTSAIELNPNNADLYINRGKTYKEQSHLVGQSRLNNFWFTKGIYVGAQHAAPWVWHAMPLRKPL